MLGLAASCSGGDTPPPGPVTSRIGPDGGKVEDASGNWLEVPAGALDTEIELTMSALTAAELGELPPLPLAEGSAPLTAAIEVLPHGTVFNQEVELGLAASQLPAGCDVKVFWLADRADTEWKLEDSVTCDAAAVRIRRDQLSIFIVAPGSGQQARVDPVCHDTGWCWENPLPHGGHLGGIWGPSADEFYTIGEGYLMHYTATRVTRVELPPGGTGLRGIWGSSASDIFVVDITDQIFHYDGTTWSEMDTGDLSGFMYNVWGSGPDNVYVGGGLANMLHYDGSTWSNVELPIVTTNRQPIYSIWGTDASNIYAGSGNKVLLHYDGTSWEIVPVENGESFTSIWGSGPNDVFAMSSTKVFHYDGTTWENISPVTQTVFTEVWGRSATEVYVLSAAGNAFRYDGTTWETLNTGISETLYAVWSPTPDRAIAVGRNGTLVELSNGQFTPLTSAPTRSLSDVWISPSGSAFAVGRDGTILTRGQSGSWVAEESGVTTELIAVDGSSESELFAVGPYNTLLRRSDTGWSPVDLPDISTSLGDLWSAGPGSAYAVGYSGAILRYDGATWTSVDSGITNDLAGVWGLANNDVFVVGRSVDSGNVDNPGVPFLHYDGTSWTQLPSVPIVVEGFSSAAVTAIWGTAANNIYVVGANRENRQKSYDLFRYDGTAWTEIVLPEDIRIYDGLMDVWGTSPTDIYVVGGSGLVVHYDGATWSEMATGAYADLQAIAGTPAGALWVVGESGAIFHRP